MVHGGSADLARASAQARPGAARLRRLSLAKLLVGAVPGLAAGAAHAGPWIPEEDALAIASVAIEPAAQEVSLYGEKPLWRQRVSVVGRAHVSETRDVSRREGDVLLKAALRRGHVAAAASAGPIWTQAEGLSCSGWGAESRAAIGASHRQTFVAAESAQRVYAGCVGSRVEATVGSRVAEGGLALAQVFYDDEAFSEPTTRVQLSFVQNVSPRVGVQVGVRRTLEGGDRGEIALTLGLWLRKQRTG